MKLIYVRHGEVEKENGGLSETGKKQAEAVVSYVKSENPVKIYCSPQLRARQTAEIISKGLDLPVEVIDEIDERVQAKLEEQDELVLIEKNYFNYNYVNPKIQTCKDFIDKNFKGFEKIMAKHKENDESVIIVAHSSTLYAVATFVNGIPKDRDIVWMQCSNCAVVKFFVENTKKA